MYQIITTNIHIHWKKTIQKQKDIFDRPLQILKNDIQMDRFPFLKFGEEDNDVERLYVHNSSILYKFNNVWIQQKLISDNSRNMFVPIQNNNNNRYERQYDFDPYIFYTSYEILYNHFLHSSFIEGEKVHNIKNMMQAYTAIYNICTSGNNGANYCCLLLKNCLLNRMKKNTIKHRSKINVVFSYLNMYFLKYKGTTINELIDKIINVVPNQRSI